MAGDFFPVGIAYSIVGDTAWEPTPWRAVQRAVGDVKQTGAMTDRSSAERDVRLRGSSEPAKQIIKHLIHVRRGLIQKCISGGAGFELRKRGSEFALTKRSLPSEQRAHSPYLKMKGQYLRRESSH